MHFEKLILSNLFLIHLLSLFINDLENLLFSFSTITTSKGRDGIQFIALQRSHSQGCTTTFKLVFASYTPEDRTGLMFLALRWFPVISISHRNLILRY